MKTLMVIFLFVAVAVYSGQVDVAGEYVPHDSAEELSLLLPGTFTYGFSRSRKTSDGLAKPFSLEGRWMCNRSSDEINTIDDCSCECENVDDCRNNCDLLRQELRQTQSTSDSDAPVTGKLASCNRTINSEGREVVFNCTTNVDEFDYDAQEDIEFPGECVDCSVACRLSGISVETCICDCVEEKCSNCRNVDGALTDLPGGPFKRMIGAADTNVNVRGLGNFCVNCRKECVSSGFIVHPCVCGCIFENCTCLAPETIEEDIDDPIVIIRKLQTLIAGHLMNRRSKRSSGSVDWDAMAKLVVVWSPGMNTTHWQFDNLTIEK